MTELWQGARFAALRSLRALRGEISTLSVPPLAFGARLYLIGKSSFQPIYGYLLHAARRTSYIEFIIHLKAHIYCSNKFYNVVLN